MLTKMAATPAVSAGEEQPPLFLSLPFHIRELVFSFLHLDDRLRQGRVCQDLYEVATMVMELNFSKIRRPRSRHKLFLQHEGSRMAVVEGIVQRSGMVQVLRAGTLPWPTSIWGSMPFLSTLDLAWMNKEVLDAVLQNCNLIEELTLRNMEAPVDVGSLVSCLPRLTSLSLSRCGLAMTSEHLPPCPYMKKLSIDHDKILTDEILLALLSLLQNLCHLGLNDCPKLTDASLNQIGKCLPLLSSLKLSSVQSTADGLAVLLASLPVTLHEAAFQDCGCQDRRLMELFRRCPALKKLCFCSKEFTDAGIAAALSVLPEGHFTEMTLSSSDSIQGTFFISHSRLFMHLKRLHVNHNSILQDASMETLLPYCPLLEVVGLDWCKALTDRTLVALGARCSLLRHLDCTSTDITDAGLAAVIQGCPHLKVLWASYCIKLTYRSLALIGDSLPLLSLLAFSQEWSPEEGETVEDYTEAALKVATRCPQLTLVMLPAFRKHASRVAAAFTSQCRSLGHYWSYDCPSIALEDVTDCCPWIVFSFYS